jgi:hypothetical protein
MTFDPTPHLIQLKGSEYLEVKFRLQWFRDAHPDGQVVTSIEQLTPDFCLAKATVSYRVKGDGSATDPIEIAVGEGHKTETPQSFPDFVEKAETGAVGRALATLGFGTQFVGGEFDEGTERIVDAPVRRAPRPSSPPPAREPAAAAPATPEPSAPAPALNLDDSATDAPLAYIPALTVDGTAYDTLEVPATFECPRDGFCNERDIRLEQRFAGGGPNVGRMVVSCRHQDESFGDRGYCNKEWLRDSWVSASNG